jgi:hypothetical protein
VATHHFFANKQQYTRYKQHQRPVPVVMQAKTMAQRHYAQHQGQANHEEFEKFVFYNVYPKKRQAAYKQRQHGTVNGTSNGRSYAQAIPIYFQKQFLHLLTSCFATALQTYSFCCIAVGNFAYHDS